MLVKDFHLPIIRAAIDYLSAFQQEIFRLYMQGYITTPTDVLWLTTGIFPHWTMSWKTKQKLLSFSAKI